MQLPSWLAGLTGANKFANNPANGFAATLGDMGQSALHSMLQHYRGKGGTYGGPAIIAGLNGSADAATPVPGVPASPLSAILPPKPIEGSELAPVVSPLAPPEPAPPPAMSPEARSALTAQLNGGQAWGQQPPQAATLPGAAGQIPLALLLRLGLR